MTRTAADPGDLISEWRLRFEKWKRELKAKKVLVLRKELAALKEITKLLEPILVEYGLGDESSVLWNVGTVRMTNASALDTLDRLECRLSGPRGTNGQSPGTAQTPTELLFGWKEILSVVQLKSDRKTTIVRLNKEFSGPIIVGNQGEKPTVGKAAMLNWWNRLEIRIADKANRLQRQIRRRRKLQLWRVRRSYSVYFRLY